MDTGTKHRLAAILAADVVGYSRLIAADEAGTLAAMRAHRSELWDPLTEAHGGRLVGTAGDSRLVEFPSTVAAVECAVTIQRAMVERDTGLPEDRRIRLRIGINLGDVAVDGDDILGDGVNVAARLEAEAAPDGVCVSDDVVRQIQGRLNLNFEDGGERELKNIAHPVRLWHWYPEAQPAKRAEAPSALPLPAKPSIAILPFGNLSAAEEDEYFADGIVEDIITDLSRFRDLFVIARNSSFTYKGNPVNIATVARDLGVQYVLEGSVRRMGKRIRVTVQLIDAISNVHLWAQRYDGAVDDVFEFQEEVTRQVIGHIAQSIEKSVLERAERGERRFDAAHDLAWRSFAKFQHAMSAGVPSSLDEAIELARRSLAQNDKCAMAYLSVCWSLAMQNLYSWGDDPHGAADRALDYAQAAMRALPQSDIAFNCLGVARFRRGQQEQAVRDFRAAHDLNPNDVRTLVMLAWSEATLGLTADARRHATQALRLSPKDIWSQLAYLSLAMATFIERDEPAFLDWADKAIQALPVAPIRRALMISWAAEAGDRDLLEVHLDALNDFAPDFIASLFRGENRLYAKDEHMEMLMAGLRKAGLAPSGA